MGDNTFVIDTRATAAAGAAIRDCRRPVDGIERALGSLDLPPATPSISAELAAYLRVWGDAVNALGNGLNYLGANVQVAARTVEDSEVSSASSFDRRRLREGI